MIEDTLSLSYTKDTLTATLQGEIDHHSVIAIRTHIDEALYTKRPSLLVIDIGRVDFMDSSGLGLIMGRLAKAREIGTKIAVANPSVRAAKMFKMAGLEHLIQNERK